MAEIRVAPPLTTPPPFDVDLQITAMEVTQAIQLLDNSMPLVRGKATVVRVYVDINFPIGLITVTLVLLHSGRGGGLSDMFGGGLGSAAAGSTSMERNLDRLTVLMGLIFSFMTIALALIINA